MLSFLCINIAKSEIMYCNMEEHLKKLSKFWLFEKRYVYKIVKICKNVDEMYKRNNFYLFKKVEGICVVGTTSIFL